MRAYAIRQFILWTAAAVVTMGAIVLFTLAQPPSTVQLSRRTVNPELRKPASVQPVFDDSSTAPQAIELDLPCEGKTEFPKAVAQVRLSGASCLPVNSKFDIASVELVNVANGFSATVFQPSPKTFTTDYVALADGENKFKILIQFVSGEREERSYSIHRRN